MCSVGPALRIHLIAALALGATACAPGAGPEGPVDPNCLGAKCDDPVGPPTPHALAVADCDARHALALGDAEDAQDQGLSAWNEYHACLLSADNGAIPTIEQNLASTGKPAPNRDAILEVFDEFRYASLCSDIEAIASVLGDELALVAARCTTRRERSLAHVLSALVDYTGERSTVFFSDEREQFGKCYLSYDAAVTGDLPRSEAYDLRRELVQCAGDELQGDALVVKEAYCALLGCPDDLLITSFIQAGFATAIDTSGNTCEVLVDASIYSGEDGKQQALNCRLSIYAQLRTATLDGLNE